MITRTSLGLALVGLLLLSACASRPTRCCPSDARVARDPNAPLPAQVFIDATIVRIPEARVAAELAGYRPTHGRAIHTLEARQAEEMLAAWRDNDDVQIIQTPKLLALDRQEATMFIGENIRFAGSYANENERGGLEFGIDEVGSFDIGERIEITPRVYGSRVGLELHRTYSELKKPFGPPAIPLDELKRKHARGEIVAEYVRSNEVEAQFEMENGSWVLLGSPEWFEDDEGRALHVIVLNVRVLDL